MGARRRRAVLGCAPGWWPSLGGEHGDDASCEDLFAAWTTFFERLAGHGEAVTLLIDDAQYADQGFADFLEHLVANAAHTGVRDSCSPDPSCWRHTPSSGGGRSGPRSLLELLNDGAMETLVAGLVEGLPDEARSAWWRGPRESRCTPSRPCAL